MVGRKRKFASMSTKPNPKPPQKLKKTKGSDTATRVKKAKLGGPYDRFCKKGQKMNLPTKSQSIIPLDQLPMEVLEKLTSFLDVVSLARLSSTNHFFQQLITGRFLLNVNFPFDQAFLDELGAASVIEKKPLLRLTCSKVAVISSKTNDSELVGPKIRSLKPLLNLQLSMLDLSRLQDLTLGAADQACRGIPCICRKCKSELAAAKRFDDCLLEQLGPGQLSQLRSLQVLVDDIDNHFLRHLRNLESLTVIVSHSSALHKLERIVPQVKAPELTVKAMCVVKKKPAPRLLYNTSVKKLHVRGPCDLQFHVQMPKIEHIIVKPLDVGSEYGQEVEGGMPCQFSAESRAKHGVGQCCVDIRAILQGHCPNIKTFSGLTLRESSGRLKSKQQVRSLLHKDYLANGGADDLGQWSRGYWRGRNLTMAHHGFPNLFNLCAMM